MKYAFRVTDGTLDDYWGDIRMTAESPAEAESLVRTHLEREEVEPNGSLLPYFKMTRIPEEDSE